jgi:hypothetical protein
MNKWDSFVKDAHKLLTYATMYTTISISAFTRTNTIVAATSTLLTITYLLAFFAERVLRTALKYEYYV